MIEARASLYVTTALAGGVLAALLAPTTTRAAECGAVIHQTFVLPGNTVSFTLPGFTTGLTTAIGSVVTTTDSALEAQGSSAFVVATPTSAPDQQGGGVWARDHGILL
jgi:hypothetical protein